MKVNEAIEFANRSPPPPYRFDPISTSLANGEKGNTIIVKF